MPYVPGPAAASLAKPTLHLQLAPIKVMTELQSFSQDPQTGEWFVSQAVGDDCVIHRHRKDGAYVSSMVCIDAGHGSSISVERAGSKLFVWLSWNSISRTGSITDRAVARVAYTAKTRRKVDAELIDVFTPRYSVPALDVAGGLIAVRTTSGDTETYTIRRLDDVMAKRDKPLGKVGPFSTAETYQGHAVAGGSLYRLTGKTNASTEYAAKKLNRHRLREYDWTTGKERTARDITNLGTQPKDSPTMSQEPEGVEVTPAGLLVGFKCGGGASRRFRLINVSATTPTPTGTDPPMPSWRLAPILKQLQAELNEHWPLRDKTSDGTLGNAAHSARLSDHNPDGRRVVCAIDVDEDLKGSKATSYPRFNSGAPAKSVFVDILLARAKAGKLPWLNYVIYEARIASKKTGFNWKSYNGPNAHDHHVHVSVFHDPKLADSRGKWLLWTEPEPTTVAKLPSKPKVTVDVSALQHALKKGLDAGADGKELQAALNRAMGTKLTLDGQLGRNTRQVAAAFQAKTYDLTTAWPAAGHHPDADGVLGKESLSKLGLGTTA